jgi:hypothetical protein
MHSVQTADRRRMAWDDCYTASAYDRYMSYDLPPESEEPPDWWYETPGFWGRLWETVCRVCKGAYE